MLLRSAASALFLIAILVNTSLGATIYVPDHYTTIQAAISAAGSGDLILVRPGTYHENIDYSGKAITIRSDQGPGVTVIDGQQQSSVVVFQSGEDFLSVLDGFTITNGKASEALHYGGGGIHCFNSSPMIINNVITKNTAAFAEGGGIYCEKASPTVRNNTIHTNDATYGGGIFCDESSPAIFDNVITENTAKGTVGGAGGGICCEGYSHPSIKDNMITKNLSGSGGGVYVSDAEPHITGNTISGNTADYSSGGGISILGYLIHPEINNNIIIDNLSAVWGGGISTRINTLPKIEENQIARNTAQSGGGIYCEGDGAQILDNLIEDNTATVHGGGVECYMSSNAEIRGNLIRGNLGFEGGGIGASNGSSPVIAGNEIEANAADNDGGGIHCIDSSSPTIDSNRIVLNSAVYNCGGVHCGGGSAPDISNNVISHNTAFGAGGGIECIDNSSPAIINNVIAGNTVQAATGGGIYCGYSSTPAITNNTVFGNSALNGGGIFCYSSRPSIYNSIFWDNSPDQIGGVNLTVANCDVQGGYSGPGNINADPLFAGTSSEDFHLTLGSPCKNGGDNSAPGLPVSDFEGDPRVAEGVVDMGADERHPHLYHDGHIVPGGSITVRVIGQPGEPVTLALGAGLQNPPQATPYGDLYITYPPAKTFSLGTVPSQGVLVFGATLPLAWQTGDEYPFQALLGPMAPGSILTNLMVLVVE